MLNRLRSSSIGSLIDLASPRSEVETSQPHLPHSATTRQNSLSLALINRVPYTPSPLSGSGRKSNRTPQISPQAERALTVSKRELTEVIELLQQVRPNDLSQTRALLSLMVAILSDTPKCREAMKENAGFLTLVTVLASLDTDVFRAAEPTALTEDQAEPGPEPTISIEDKSESKSTRLRRVPSTSIGSDAQFCLTDSRKPACKSSNVELQEERDAVAKLVFKCLALALSDHRENQLFFSTKLGFKLVLDALRLSNFTPQSRAGNQSDWLSAPQRRQKIEKLFGIIFSFITADFSCVDVFSAVRIRFNQQREINSSAQNLANLDSEAASHLDPHPTNRDGQGPSAAPMLSKLDHNSKYSKLAALLRKVISDRVEPLV